MQLFVNGQAHAFEAPPTVSQVLDRLVLSQRRIAVERNGAIIPRSHYGNCHLEEGDCLEIVVAVGGG